MHQAYSENVELNVMEEKKTLQFYSEAQSDQKYAIWYQQQTT